MVTYCDADLSSYLADLNGGGGPRIAGEAGFEGRDFTESPPPTGIDSGHPEFVGGAWQEFLFLQDVDVSHIDHINVLSQGKKRSFYLSFYTKS